MSTARKAIESTYKDICTVYGFKKVKEGSISRNERAVLHENLKCALSLKSLRPSSQSDTVNTVSYDVKLFIAPEITIEPGSQIEVSRLGNILKFVSAGEPFLYETHQEIMLLRNTKV